MQVMHVMIYKLNINFRITSEGIHGLYKVTISPHATDLSADKTLVVDFHRVLQSTSIDT
jgi:hypothetical protein